MDPVPETQYVRSGAGDLAYQVFGDGPDVLSIPGAAHHLELRWEEPQTAAMWQRMGRYSRIAVFDRRGCGLSDRSVLSPDLESQVPDVVAVMDAAAMPTAVLSGHLDGGWLAMLVALHHPDRVRGLVLESTTPCMLRRPDFPSGIPAEDWDALAVAIDDASTDDLVGLLAPSRVGDARFAKWFGRYWRSGAGPGGIRRLMEMSAEIDLRPVLADIHQPALVLHREGDLLINVESARYLAEHLPNAELVVVPGLDNSPASGDVDRWVDAIERFVTGTTPRRRPNRVVSTVLFTDIVDSTRRASSLGDRRWRQLLEAHNALALGTVEEFGGRVVEWTGDGLLAVFPDPQDAVECALRLIERTRDLDLDLRAGLHMGQIELRDGLVGGIAVHLAARVSAKATAGQVLASRTIRDVLTGSELEFRDAGAHAFKGIPDSWQLYEVAEPGEGS